MIYCFDIDGTLCTNTDGDYEKAEPYLDVIAQVNALYDTGHRIIIYTARGSTTGIDWRELTRTSFTRGGLNTMNSFWANQQQISILTIRQQTSQSGK